MKISKITRMERAHIGEVLWIEQASSLTPWSERMFIEELQNPFAHCFVYQAQESNRSDVLGFVCFRNVGEESELLNLGVHPLHRHLGIGRELMRLYLDFSEKMQAKRFYLEVHVSNVPAIDLYRSFSYQTVQMRKKFYQGKHDALVMLRKV